MHKRLFATLVASIICAGTAHAESGIASVYAYRGGNVLELSIGNGIEVIDGVLGTLLIEPRQDQTANVPPGCAFR